MLSHASGPYRLTLPFARPLQPSPHRRDERPVSCYTPSSNSNLGPGGRDAVSLAKDKQRAYMPNLVNNETYGTILNTNPPQPSTTSAPPLPPRNLGNLSDTEKWKANVDSRKIHSLVKVHMDE